MKFRFKAFGYHLVASAFVLTVILGSLYFGWYHWPGWYLTDVTHVVLVMIAVDLVVGPSLTFVIAKSTKPLRELTRDIGLIALLQLCALGYGSYSLWSGRPMYYAFSESVLQLVQAYDINHNQAELAQEKNPALAPHWYSLPRQVWAPLPDDQDERAKIVSSAISGGDDIIDMPKDFKAWDTGLPALKAHLKKVADVAYFAPKEKEILKRHMRDANFSTDELNAMPLSGRGPPLLAVFNLKTMQIAALLKGK